MLVLTLQLCPREQPVTCVYVLFSGCFQSGRSFANSAGKIRVFGPSFCSTRFWKNDQLRLAVEAQPAECVCFRGQRGSGEAASGTRIGSHLSCCSNKMGGGRSGLGEKCIWPGYFERI